MKFRHYVLAISFIALACSKSKTTGNGSFPNFYEKTKATTPTIDSSLILKFAAESLTKNFAAKPAFTSSAFPSSSNASTDANEFKTAFDINSNYIGQLLNDPGAQGPVKSMYVLLNHVQSTLSDINSQYSDDSGQPTNCTAISAGTKLKVPFFDSATNAPFVSFDDSGKYTCYFTSGGSPTSITAFGRSAIASPTSGCTDAFEYYVLSGYSEENAENTEQTSTRGTSKNISSISHFYYNGCTQELKLAYAQQTKYSSGTEFSSRSEISGNVGTHAFDIRSHFIDVGKNEGESGYATHITIVGSGKSKTSDSSTPARFIMGYRSDNCGTDITNTASCTEGTAQSFCVQNSGSASEYAQDTTVSDCSSLDTAYAALTPLVRSDLPTAYFAVNASAFGL